MARKIGYIGKLYAIEREQKERSDAERYQARQTRSMPLLAELKTWLDNNVGKVMKGSLTRQAMEYTLGQWPHLVGYCVHIPADHEHQFRFNVNTISGPM